MTKALTYPPAMVQQAYDAYLSGNMDLERIALDVEVSLDVLRGWVRDGNWRERKREVDLELFQDAENQYRTLVAKNRIPVAERHLRVAGKLEDAVEKLLDKVREEIDSDDPSPKLDMTLRRLSETLSAATTVSARAGGVTEKLAEAAGHSGHQKQPLVVVNVTPGVSRGERDVTPAVTVSETPRE